MQSARSAAPCVSGGLDDAGMRHTAWPAKRCPPGRWRGGAKEWRRDTPTPPTPVDGRADRGEQEWDGVGKETKRCGRE